MSNSEGSTPSLVDLETAQSKTISMRRDRSEKITTLHSKVLDLQFNNLVNTKYLMDTNGSSKQILRSSENNIDLSLIKEPTKINLSFLQENDNDKIREIKEALNTFKFINQVNERLNGK
ncbi:hypothetical protein WDU94_013657 [Cyamophila willieti]